MELDGTFDDGFSAHATRGLDGDGGGTLTREELRPRAQVNVELLHKSGSCSCLDLTGVAEVCGAQAEAESMLCELRALHRTELF